MVQQSTSNLTECKKAEWQRDGLWRHQERQHIGVPVARTLLMVMRLLRILVIIAE